MERDRGHGRPDQKSRSQKNAPLKEQGSPKVASEAGNDYIGMLNSIRADQDLNTFVADLRQNKEQLISLARMHKIKPADAREEIWDNLALGIYLEVALKETYLFKTSREINPGDYLDEDSDKPLTEVERREILAFWATERIASKWLVTHPDSKAAKEVMHWSIAFPEEHHKLLQEMWPSILPQLAK